MEMNKTRCTQQINEMTRLRTRIVSKDMQGRSSVGGLHRQLQSAFSLPKSTHVNITKRSTTITNGTQANGCCWRTERGVAVTSSGFGYLTVGKSASGCTYTTRGSNALAMLRCGSNDVAIDSHNNKCHSEIHTTTIVAHTWASTGTYAGSPNLANAVLVNSYPTPT
jgi:hypothetical protein